MSDFAEIDSNAPQIPEYTCPMIDRAISIITSAVAELDGMAGRYGDLNDARTDDNDSAIDACAKTVNDATSRLNDLHGTSWTIGGRENGLLEKIRAANSELRAAAVYWRDTAENLCNDLAIAKERIDELDEQLSGLRVDEAA